MAADERLQPHGPTRAAGRQGLQRHVGTRCIPGCSRMHPRLQPHAIQASIPCHPRPAAPPSRPAPRVHASAEVSPIASCVLCGGRHATIRPSRAPPRASSPAAGPPYIQSATVCTRAATVCIQVRRRVPACGALRVRLVACRPGLHRRRAAADHRRPGAECSHEARTWTCTCACDMCMRIHARTHTHTHTHAHAHTHT